jgi:hypothetical protein
MTTPVKATLSVILKANDVVVAEVEDPVLWQRILTAINRGKNDGNLDPDGAGAGRDGDGLLTDDVSGNNGERPATGSVDALAKQLGIDAAVVQGACSPTNQEPYLHLDAHCWEVMKRQLPARGPTALSPIVAAATMLALWFNKAGLGNPTQAQAKAVLATINVGDPNASRSIQNATWLQGRAGGQIILNPAEISKAVKLTKSFCSKDWGAWKETAN